MGKDEIKPKLDIPTIDGRLKLPEARVLPTFIISLVLFLGSGAWQFFAEKDSIYGYFNVSKRSTRLLESIICQPTFLGVYLNLVLVARKFWL